ncbi:MAG: hypothetical protein ACREJ3_10075, partial [Polyangiaceae bacterium]
MNKKRSVKWSFLAAVIACGAAAAMSGCELLVNFDRSKIPVDASTADASGTDGSLPEQDAEGDSTTPGTDATTNGDASADASEDGSPDGGEG